MSQIRYQPLVEASDMCSFRTYLEAVAKNHRTHQRILDRQNFAGEGEQ
ncbi:MAG: hypothetical protein YYHSYBAR_003133 [Candidatus Fervidibacter sacchari]